VSSTVEAAGKQDFAGKRVAQHPEHVMGFVGLETIQSQNDMTLLRQELLETSLVGQTQSEQLFVALKQVGDGALGDGNMTLME
jgi:hypothetical protein